MNYSLFFIVAVSVFWTQVDASVLPEGISSRFIVGGVEAEKGEFPWIVNIKIFVGGGYQLCGGSLIAHNLVLTAAHCVYQENVQNILVTAGDHNIQVNEGIEQTSGAMAVKVHPGYNPWNLVNDIALIQLEKNFTRTVNVRPINLPDASFNGSLSEYGTVAGWGTLRYQGFTSRTLQKVNVSIVNDPACSEQQITDRKLQFCAGDPGKDSCQGDSGGPLICNDAPDSVCGIVSYGINCGIFPGVYTHVASYVGWINQNRNFA